MTTLPQMTSLRLPRATGAPAGAPMAIPTMGMGPVAAPKMSGADVWRVIRGNLWLIITMLLVMSVLGYVGNEYYLIKYYPRYTATGWIQVQPAFASVTSVTPRGERRRLWPSIRATFRNKAEQLSEALFSPQQETTAPKRSALNSDQSWLDRWSTKSIYFWNLIHFSSSCHSQSFDVRKCSQLVIPR